MATMPHDVTDLYLAPVALAVDRRLGEFAAMTPDELSMAIAEASDMPDWTAGMRDDAVLIAASHLIETHGWELEWDPRGIRLRNREHTIVLGVPENVTAYRASGIHAPAS